MEWRDEGLIIGTRKHGENAVIIEAMTNSHGRHLGLVRGGRSRRFAAILQAGNTVELSWRARLEDHLGNYTVEAKTLRAAGLMQSRNRLSLSQLICEHLRILPEREPHPRLLAEATAMHDADADGYVLGCALAKFEMRLLNELGFGIDIASCALTGEEEGLAYISPKTGRAVTVAAAQPYLEKLMRLPHIFGGSLDMDPKEELESAFNLTAHFMNMHIWLPRQLSPPSMRERLIKSLCDGL
ncbi:DNA repair protein RecO [Maritalea porphyrae]|jgi:DNA repair protein RecO (recombination protein O)|uniref:DNA repair protein RecO n=1 Tax=Maritalea porphyrae TaxID=880732 RepID=UPI0022AF4610|nr:DNA repair protein RecO [Maritalea porphyrae]MCZ4270844.1 DNA repair protein RecO [Maritalea porphyrae]